MNQLYFNRFQRALNSVDKKDIDMTIDGWIESAGIATNYGHGYEWIITEEDEMVEALEKSIEAQISDMEENEI